MDSPTVLLEVHVCVVTGYIKSSSALRVDSFVKNRFIILLSRLQYVTDVTDFVTNYNCGIRNQFKI
jgi:hypothetical protein